MTASQIDIDAILAGGRRRTRLPWLVAGGATLLAVIAGVLMTRGGSEVVLAEPTPVEVSLGQITSSSDFSGTASAPLLENLVFGIAGTVTAIQVAPGDLVAEGDVIATLDTRDLALAVRQAELDLQLAQQKLNELLADNPSVAAQVVSAQQSQRSAEQRVANAEAALSSVLSPSDSEVNAAYSLVQQRQDALTDAQAALGDLRIAPTAEELLQAEASVTNRETELITAANALAAGYTNVKSITARILLNFDDTTRLDHVVAALTTDPDPLLKYVSGNLDLDDRALEVAYRQAKLNLADAHEALSDLQSWTPEEDEVARAERVVRDAEYALGDAQADLALLNTLWAGANLQAPLGAAASADDVVAAQEEIEAARSALEASRLNLAATLDNATVDGSAITSDLLGVARAEAALASAQDNLDAATLRAPFAGTIESVDIQAGDRVTATTPVSVLLNEQQIEIDLTVTESDLPLLQVGQTGTATFTALSGRAFAVRITSISRVPSTEQGVVSYAAIALITGIVPGGAPTGRPAPSGAAPGGGAFDQDAIIEALTTAGVTIPDGVDVRAVIQALASGGELPQGVTVPEGFSVADLLGGARGQGPPGAGNLPAAPTDSTSASDRISAGLMPAPGMSASVTIVLSVSDQAVLAPIAGVRQIDGAYYVSVPGADGLAARREVTIGASDGTSVAILSGLESGETILLGAETEGVPLSVSQTAQAATTPAQGFGGQFGGGFGGGPAGGGR